VAQPVSELRVMDDAEALARAAAEEVVRCAEAAVRDRGRFTIALSGGSTPRRLHRLLADREAPFYARIEWSAAHFFWGDERHVPPDHPDSNYRMARETLLDSVPVPAENIHRIHAELPDATEAAEAYEIELRRAFALTPGEVPRFDFALMGIGADGHTASLFPGSDALHERERLVIAPWVDKLSTFRITLTLPVFESAAEVLFLVSGEDKAVALQAVLGEVQGEPERYPAQLVRPREGRLLWLADRTAASRLE
jgi:6-phosphogluconolactonase